MKDKPTKEDWSEAQECVKIREQNEQLLEILIKCQKRLEILIGITPTGEMRNTLCNENIKALEIIYKAP